ncbi:MAG TPA: NUDIX hydrolase [Chloroflexi bacterium]|nr:NUDIX hydrolase [Chloroflexota bacterium]
MSERPSSSSSNPPNTPSQEHPAVAVDVVIFMIREGRLQVLLVKRRYPPFEGRWAIPGGFVHIDESLEDAARRELREETGVEDVYLEQLYTFGRPDRDPRMRVISVTYFALLPAGEIDVRAGDDAADARWFPVDDLPPLAFDHREIIEYALTRLRYKLEYTDVGFQLLPAEFTLTELQRAYEIVLGEQLDKRNFRRKILQSRILRETGRLRAGEGRPARLYEYRSDVRLQVKARRLFP